jgi:preprotein translocase subunit SecF
MMVAFPVVWLWVATGGALSLLAAVVAVGIFVAIVLGCVAAGRLARWRGRRA